MRSLAARMGRTASSITAIGTRPASTSAARFRPIVLLAMSTSSPAATARRAASAPSAAKPWVMQVRDPEGVAHHEALEAPLAAEHVAQEEAVGGGGHVVQLHVGAHEGADSGLGRGLEGRKVDVAQQALGQVHRVVVAAAVGGAVAREVLGARDEVLGRARVGALEAAHLGRRHGRAQVRILAGALDHASPARVARDVEHGREGPVQARGPGFARGHRLRLLVARGVPRRGHGQGHREDRAVAVDHVEGEEHRDLEPRLLDRDLLERVELLRVVEPEHRAGAALADRPGGVHSRERADLGELADLLGQRHLAEQGRDLLLDLRVGEGGRLDGPSPNSHSPATAENLLVLNMALPAFSSRFRRKFPPSDDTGIECQSQHPVPHLWLRGIIPHGDPAI